MWSCASVGDGAKDGSLFTRSDFRVRLEVAALRRHVRHTNDAASDDEKREGLSRRGRKVVAIGVVAWMADAAYIERRRSLKFEIGFGLKSLYQVTTLAYETGCTHVHNPVYCYCSFSHLESRSNSGQPAN